MKPKISACILAKNEEKLIADSIKSVLPVVYEIIVLDTGSTDNTKKIASSFPKTKIYESTWENDFSKARNKCASYATGEWILRIDADERLTSETQKNLIPFLNKSNFGDKSVILDFNILEYDVTGTFITSYFKNYLYKKNNDIKFMLPLHETLFSENKETLRYNIDFLTVFHVGESDTDPILLKEKKIKYINQLVELIKNNTDETNYYYYRHLGDEYFDIAKHDKALNFYMSSYHEIKKHNINNLNFYHSVINRIIKELIFFHKEYNKAIFFIEEELKIMPNSIEALFHLGFCKNRLDNTSEGVEIQKKALNSLEENELSKSIIANLCVEIGRFSNDISFLLKAHSIFPNSIPILRHIVRLYLYMNKIEQAINYYSLINKLNGVKELTLDNSKIHSMLINELNKESSWENHEKAFLDKFKAI